MLVFYVVILLSLNCCCLLFIIIIIIFFHQRGSKAVVTALKEPKDARKHWNQCILFVCYTPPILVVGTRASEAGGWGGGGLRGRGRDSLANLYHTWTKLSHSKAFLVIQKLSQFGDHRKDIHFLQSLFCCRVPFSKIRQIYIPPYTWQRPFI